jgi:putative transposase
MFNNDFEKINQIELDTEYAYVSVSFNEPPPYEPGGFIGVDLNTTGHCAVVANPLNGDVFKFGKSAQHTHEKYSAMRRGLQKKGKLRRLKKTRNRESRKIRDMNQKISRRIVSIAKENNCGIRMEALDGIHQRAKSTKSFRYSLNSWSFYQIRSMVEYKAKLLGVPVEHIDPRYTSQLCSRCGCMGNRNGKEFECRHCGHVDNADVNASFNIALRQEGVYQSGADRVVSEGNTDIPKGAPLRTMATLELP